MTTAIIPVTNIQEALQQAQPYALVVFPQTTPENAVARYRCRFDAIPPKVYKWGERVLEVVTNGKKMTQNVWICGIPCDEVTYKNGKKVTLDTPPAI